MVLKFDEVIMEMAWYSDFGGCLLVLLKLVLIKLFNLAR